MASPQQILDDLVQLFHSDRGEPLVRYIAGVSLVKSLTVLVMEKREQLRPIFFRRQSDLLAGFAVDCDLLPGNPAQRHKEAFGEAVEWMRCYFDPLADEGLLLSHASTLAQDQPACGKSSRGLW